MTNTTVIARSQPKQSRADRNGIATLVVRLARSNAGRCLAALAGFLISFQTIWILRPGVLGGVSWPLATIGLTASDVVLLIAAVVGVVKIFFPPHDGRGNERGWGSHRHVLTAFVILLIAASVNVWGSVDPWLSAVGWARVAALLLAVAGVPYRPGTSRAFLGGFLVAMLVHIGLGVAQVAALESSPSTLLGVAHHAAWVRGDAVIEAVDGRWLRAYGGFPHPNVFGTALLVALVIVTHSFSIPTSPPPVGRGSERGWVTSAFRIGLASFLTFALTITFSRAALLGLVVLVVVLAVRRGSRSLASVIAVTALFSVAATWSLWTPRFAASGSLEARSIEDRWIAFSDARTLLSYPSHLLIGVGLHGMPAAILSGVDTSRNPYMAQPVHNVPLLAFVEGGVLLGCAVLAIIIVLAFRHPFLLVLAPPLLLDHHLWSLPIGLALVFTLVVSRYGGGADRVASLRDT